METENPNESILKPKAKRNLTDEQRLALSERMKLVNQNRLAAKRVKSDSDEPTEAINKVENVKKATLPTPVEAKLPSVETPKPQKKKRVVKVVEISEPDETDSESEEEIVIVPKKKVVKKVTRVPEEEKPKRITKPKTETNLAKKTQPIIEDPPKILYRFL